MSIIGVEWNQGTDTWSRIDVAGDPLSPPTFNSEAPWGDIVRCTLNADGSENEVSANGKGNDITLDGSTGRVMVRIPKFWVKSDSPGANRYRWWISDAAYSGFVVHPAFYQRGNTDAPADYIYVGAYEAGSNSTVLRSQTGDTVKASQTIGAFRTQAEAIDSVRWGITSMWALSAIKLLYYIEYADADSQTTIGSGVVSHAKELTGADGIDANLATNGTGTGTGTDTDTPIAYRGIENLWGNVQQFIDGYEAVDAEYRIIKRDGSGTFRNPLQVGDYEASTAAPITTNGWIKNIEYETLLAYLFIPSDTAGGSGSTYLYDYLWAHDTGEVNILTGGADWASTTQSGVAYHSSFFDAAITSTQIGGRLEFIPEAPVVAVNYDRPASVIVGTVATASRTYGTVQTAAVIIGTVVSAARALALDRDSSIIIGILLPVVGVIQEYFRQAAVVVGIVVSAARALALDRDSSVIVGNLVSATKIFGKVITSSVIVGIVSTASRAITVIRTGLVIVGNLVSASKSFNRSISASVIVGNLVTASRIFGAVITSSTIIGVVVSASRTMTFIRSATTIVGNLVTSSRLVTYARYASRKMLRWD